MINKHQTRKKRSGKKRKSAVPGFREWLLGYFKQRKLPEVRTVAFWSLGITLFGAAVLLTITIVLAQDLPGLEQLETYSPRLVTRVLGRDNTLIKEFYTEQRVQVPLDDIVVSLPQAILATEDRKFFEHWGIDLEGILRATSVNIVSLSKRQGASTLTQQLARNLYLHRRRTVKRKIREIITAVQIERTYTKDEILQMYMNQMYFGHGTYGVQTAAQKYFGVDAAELNISQSAMLAALLKAPAYYSPRTHPQAAQERKDLVLRNMLVDGFVNQEEYAIATTLPLDLVPRDIENDLGKAPYFTEFVRQQLEVLEETHGFDYYKDGLEVQTTLDPVAQHLAEAAIDSHLTLFQDDFYVRFKENGYREWLQGLYLDSLDQTMDSLTYVDSVGIDTTVQFSFRDILKDSAFVLATDALRDTVWADSFLQANFVVQVAFIAMDPVSGDILAMTGGRDFHESKFNRAVQALRQPGSVFKPFVYTTAIDNGIYANHQVLNMVIPVKMPDGSVWRPENYSIDNRGSYVSLREGLRRSLNNVTVRLVSGDDRLIPISEVIRYAHRMGIRTELSEVLSLALGSNGVIPIDVVTSYGVFASGGMRTDPRSITKITSRYGQEIASFPIHRESVLSPETAYIMVDLLSGVINRGTGGSVRWRHNFYHPAAGKTGTTNNFTDAWFLGFTPRIVAGVWVGFDDPKKSLGPHQSGARAALPIWAIFMREYHKAKGWDFQEFEKPVGVVRVDVCEESGEKAGPYCPQVISEVFRRGDEPIGSCSVHRVSF
ncbi:PBP1A family penicillin-binding protein [bacterium]|nr:PBP1A family penicillin-binding protein [bacterium]